MEQAVCFTKLAMVALIAAVRSMQLVVARNGSTRQSVTDAVDARDMPPQGEGEGSFPALFTTSFRAGRPQAGG